MAFCGAASGGDEPTPSSALPPSLAEEASPPPPPLQPLLSPATLRNSSLQKHAAPSARPRCLTDAEDKRAAQRAASFASGGVGGTVRSSSSRTRAILESKMVASGQDINIKRLKSPEPARVPDKAPDKSTEPRRLSNRGSSRAASRAASHAASRAASRAASPEASPSTSRNVSRRASFDSIGGSLAAADGDDGDGGSSLGLELWAKVRKLLWRIVNPASAFAHIVRRATFAVKVAATLKRMACFAHVSHDELITLGATGALISLPRYKVLYREGARADTMYVLLSGTLEHSSGSYKVPEAQRLQTVAGNGGVLYRRGHESSRLDSDGVCVGIEVLTGVARTTTVETLKPAHLLQFDERVIPDDLRAGMVRSFAESELRAVRLFEGVAPGDFIEMVALFDIEESDDPNLTLLWQGETPDGFYILAKGTVVIEVGGNVVATLEGMNPHDAFNSYPCFGEIGLLHNMPASATVRAITKCKLLVVPGHRFHMLLQLVPDFEERVKNIAELRKKADDSRKERQGVGKQDVQLVEAMIAHSNELSASLCDRARKGHSDREEKEFKRVGVA